MKKMNSLAVVAALAIASLLSITRAEARTKTVDREVSEALKAVSVKTRLIDKLGADALGITVTVSGDTATLNGHVAKSASQSLAAEVALSVDGIKKVENKVTENTPAGPLAASEASVKNVSLELKVKTILLGEIGTNALKIEVEVVDGVVSLRGKLDSPETAKAAVRKARSIKGVKKVVDLLG
jgi:hyperosmotically inducible protein